MSTTRDKIEQYFKRERDYAREKLENIALSARRMGRAQSPSDVELDLINAWAHRALETFGQSETLTFQDHCRGATWLESQGVPKTYFADIARAVQEVSGLSLRPQWSSRLGAILREYNIENSAINHERLMISYFRAHAEAGFAVGDRYPAVNLEDLDLWTGPLANAAPRQRSAPAEQYLKVIMPDGQPLQLPVVIAALAQAGLSEENDAQPPPNSRDRQEPLAPPPDAPSAVWDAYVAKMAEEQRQIALPLQRFMTVAEEIVTTKGETWRKESARDFLAMMRMFVGVLEELGVKDTSIITGFHIGKLLMHFRSIPRNYGQSARLRSMSPAELRRESEAMFKADPDALVGLSQTTIRKHLSNLGTFLDHVRSRSYVLSAIDLAHYRPPKPKKGSIRGKQHKPTREEIRPIFGAPLFTGCKSHLDLDKPGENVFHCGLYYLPLLLTYVGARRSELAGLEVDDIVETDNGWTIRIAGNDQRGVKNAQSIRDIPVVPELQRLGFLDYHRAIKALGYKRLFPELYTSNDPARAGDTFYKKFIPIMRAALGDKMWSRAIHAFRHSVADGLKQRGIPDGIIDDIAGRLTGSETGYRYTNAAEADVMNEVLATLPCVSDNIEARPIQLLPAVANMKPEDALRSKRGRKPKGSV